eukprot:Opistho-2@42313
MEPSAGKPFHTLVDRLHMEFLFLHGLLICLDSLIYYVSFLFIKFIAALWTLIRRHLLRRKDVVIYPRHILVIMESATVCLSVLLLGAVDFRGIYVFIQKNLSWAKPYVLFQIFGVLDDLMEHTSRRVIGGIVHSVRTGQQRLAMVLMGSVLVTVHSLVLTVQMCALHVAFDSKAELLSLLLAVKMGELRSTRVSSVSKEKLFETCIADTVERFKWLVFVTMMFLEKSTSNHLAYPGDWLPHFTRSVVTVFLMEMTVDWIKHTCVSAASSDARIREVYIDFRGRLTAPFRDAPKLGLGLARTKDMQHFDFVTLPTTCVLLRLGLNCAEQLAWRPVDGSVWHGIAFFVVTFFGLCAAKVAVRQFLRQNARRVHARATGKAFLARHNSTSIPALIMEAVRQSSSQEDLSTRRRR